MDLEQRAAAMADKAKQRQAQDQQAQAQQRKAAWQTIQTADPVLADLLTAINAKTGKPAGVVVEIDGQPLVNQPPEYQRRAAWDGKLRRSI